MAVNNAPADDEIISEELLMRVDFDLAYSSEKLLNLQILSMQVADRASDYEALAIEKESASAETVEKALEFDMLSGVLDSEVKELDDFIVVFEEEIVAMCGKMSLCKHTKEAFAAMEQKLNDNLDSLKRLQYQMSELRAQSAKFKSASEFGRRDSWNVSVTNFLEDVSYSTIDTKVNQNTEQQRNLLRMLKKSLAREMEPKTRLGETEFVPEELKLKLQYAEHEIFRMKEMSDLMFERFFEAENTAEVLTLISKELIGKLQISQFNLNTALQLKADVSSKLQNSMQALLNEQSALQKLKVCCPELDTLKTRLMEAEDKCSLANFEAVSLRKKTSSLEAQLRESESQLHHVNAAVEASQKEQERLSSKITDLENIIKELKLSVSKADSRTESAESKCKLLAESNSELSKELGFCRSSGNIEKVNLLEKQLRQSDTQFQHAKASVEAIQEQQTMLYCTISDMGNLIEDLKAKASKAESRAENAEANCLQLTYSNLELNEESSFLRGRIKELEASLQKADDVKVAAANDIGVRTKVITNLVMQLAMERERLRTQIRSITKEKNILEEKYCKAKNDASLIVTHGGNVNVKESLFLKDDAATPYSKQLKAVVTESSASFQKDGHKKDIPTGETEPAPSISAVDTIGVESRVERVQATGARKHFSKYVWTAIFVAFISMLAIFLFQQECTPFR